MEWAPGNVLSQSSKTESIENNSAVVGEHDVKKVMLEQYVEGISDVDADPDRVEVSFYMLFFFPFPLSSLPFCLHICPYHKQTGYATSYFINAVHETVLTILCTQLFVVCHDETQLVLLGD